MSIPSTHECCLSNAFKVTTETDAWYIQAPTRTQRDDYMAMISEMMRQIKKIPAAPSSPVKRSGLRNVVSAY